MAEKKQKLSLFFGAGAEIDYGMPTGGEFAIDIFRQDDSEGVGHIKEIRKKIDPDSTYAEWLPRNYQRSQVRQFGTYEYKNIIKSILESRSDDILSFLSEFDKNCKECIEELIGMGKPRF